MTLTLNVPPVAWKMPSMSVDNTTGQAYYDPLTNAHPNPRYNDPNECFFLETIVRANVPMIISPDPPAIDFKSKWMSNVVRSPQTTNRAPVLYPCASLFLRKVLYVQNSDWKPDSTQSYRAEDHNNDIRYVCQRSLVMKPSCSRLGSPISSSDMIAFIQDVNPPSDITTFEF
jgi:hypothetical protein